jgi:hypothetical protein
MWIEVGVQGALVVAGAMGLALFLPMRRPAHAIDE